MRGGFFFGTARRNDPVKLVDPRPLTNYGENDIESGDAGRDGFSLLSKANPQAQGNPPLVAGTDGYAYQGPDQSFEQ
jgi:hypothetical protein